MHIIVRNRVFITYVHSSYRVPDPGTFSTERTYETVKTCEIDELSHVFESALYRNKLYRTSRLHMTSDVRSNNSSIPKVFY